MSNVDGIIYRHSEIRIDQSQSAVSLGRLKTVCINMDDKLLNWSCIYASMDVEYRHTTFEYKVHCLTLMYHIPAGWTPSLLGLKLILHLKKLSSRLIRIELSSSSSRAKAMPWS